MVTPIDRTWIIGLLVFGGVAMATVAAVLLWERWRARRQQREALEELGTAEHGPERKAAAASVLRRASGLGELRWLQPVLTRVPQLRDVDRLMQQAGVSWSGKRFLTATAVLVVLLGFGTLLATGKWPPAVVGAVLGALLPYLHISIRRKKRNAAVEEQLPDAIDLIGRAIRAGHPLSAGFKMVADEMPDPVSVEFRQVFEEQRYGMAFQDSLLGLSERVDLVDMRILSTAILVQREVGGNLAEILDKLAHVIRERFRIRRQLRVYTAQGRISGYVLALLPIVLGAVIFAINPAYMEILFDTTLGRFLLAAAITLQLMGYLWIRRIIDIEI